MPELPEVETTRRGLEAHLKNQHIIDVKVRHKQLRWPIPPQIQTLVGQQILDITRRGKYLLLQTAQSTTILHLGMSGRLRIIPANTPPQTHDHFDLVLANNTCMRFTDPRRFGAILWTDADPLHHSLLAKLGPEPLDTSFNATYLHQLAQKTSRGSKLFIMDQHIVVGVGNIYANEALFAAKIHPQKPAAKLQFHECEKLVDAIKQVLELAIAAGGTTLRDFISADGKPGYFVQSLQVYGRNNKPCYQCKTMLESIILGQRATVYCPRCQPLT